MNKDILLKDDKNNNLFPLAHKDSDQNIIKDTYAPLNMPSFTGGVGIGTSAVSNEIKSTMPLHVNGGDGLDLYYNSYGIYKDSIANENRILQLGNQRQDLILEAPSRKIFLGYQRTQSVGIYAPIDTDVSFSKNISVVGTSEFTGGIYSLSTGQVNTATSANGMLLIKRASITDDSTPNNGVVLEYGNSTSWKGQLYIGDNADQGVYVNGWNKGVRGTWKKLMFQNDLASLLEPIRVSNTSSNIGVGIGVDPQNNKVISNKEIDVVDSNGVAQSAMYPSGNIYSRKNVVSGETTDTTEVNHTVQSSGGKLQMFINDSVKGLYGVNKSSKGQNILRVMNDGRVLIYGADASGENKVLIGHNGSNLWIGCEKTGTAHHIGNTYIDAGYDSANSQGYPSICISVPNTANTSAKNYYVYHQGYFPPMSNDQMVQTGMTVYESRCSIHSGGYVKAHKMVFFHMELQIKKTLNANDYWQVLTGLPKSQYRDSALAVAGYNKKGVYNAYVSNTGVLTICTGALGLANGDYVAISGSYFFTE